MAIVHWTMFSNDNRIKMHPQIAFAKTPFCVSEKKKKVQNNYNLELVKWINGEESGLSGSTAHVINLPDHCFILNKKIFIFVKCYVISTAHASSVIIWLSDYFYRKASLIWLFLVNCHQLRFLNV